MVFLILTASIPAERSTSINHEPIINFYCEVYGSNLTLSPFALALLVCKWLFHASGNAGCPQRKQTEGTYRDLLVPLNNRTVYQRNKHFLRWNKKTAKREKRQVCNDTVPRFQYLLKKKVKLFEYARYSTCLDLKPLRG